MEFEPSFEPGEDFETELRQAFARKPAPPELKRKLMEKRRTIQPRHFFAWQRLAASIVLAAVLAGGIVWRTAEQRRRGEAARRQVMTALRITGHALNRMNTQLTAHSHDSQE